MMNHFTSLTDSSTSESEEDGKRLMQKISFDTRSPRKREISTDDTGDEQADSFSGAKKIKTEFKNPEISTDDTEDEQADSFSSAKKAKTEFKNPESDSENDEKAPSMSGFKLPDSMPTKDSLSGNYGVGMKLMEKMGYKSGSGLGKFAQGRVDIVHASKQRGRRGLGLHIAGLEPSDSAAWDSEKDLVSVQEQVDWMPPCRSEPLEISMLREWIQEGPKKMTIADETEFCDPDILKDVLAYKAVFDQLEPEEMRKARTRSNPFETIRGGIFLNRAAMKMANMDTAFDYMFTNPKSFNGEPIVSDNELLYFADICAGPGGFSEYVLWRKKWECKGFGFTLKGQNDFKLEDFYSGPPETFEPYYGVKGDGDIYAPENLRDFKKFVLANTDNLGVHFVMADGGFSVEGSENEQEILSKRLYLCQFLCALSILRPAGHFVCKLFDLFTPFSVGLVYLMYHAFERVCIFKPNTSRPANSERYIVCKWLKPNTRDIGDYMYEVNDILNKYSGDTCDKDVNAVVPLSILKEDEAFYEYIVTSNNMLGARQIVHLDKIRVYAQNTDLHDERQNDLRKQCLEFWQVPDKARSAPQRPEPKARYKEIIQGENLNALKSAPVLLGESSMLRLKSVFEFHCVVCGGIEPERATLFLGLGRSHVYRLDLKSEKFNKVEANLELPANTLFYGELVSELKGEGRAQRKISAIHIIDVICLGGKDVRRKHYTVRMQLAEKLAKAVSKPSKPDSMPLRVKTVYDFRNVEEILDSLALRLVKNSQVPRLCYDLNDGRHIVPAGLLIFRTTKDPWVIAYSKSRRKPYFFDTKKNVSSFDPIDEANADFLTCAKNRFWWSWGPGVHLISDQEFDESKKTLIHSHTMIAFVTRNLNRIMGAFTC